MNQPLRSRIRQSRSTIATIAILAAGLIVRLAVAPLGGHPGDLPVFMRWAEAIRQAGWIGVYAASDANYPPLGMGLIAFSQGAFQTVFPGEPIGGAAWLVALKLPAILADGLVMMLMARLMRGRRGSVALVASVALNPALILMSAWWGQLDSMTMALAALGIVLMIDERPFWAGLAAGAAAMVKMQGVFFVPLIVIGGLRPRRSLAWTAAGLAMGIGIPALPFVIYGQGALVLGRVVALVASPGWLTVNALNVWFLVSGGQGNWKFNAPLVWADTSPLAAGLSARVAGIVLLAGWMAFTVIGAWRARTDSAWLLAGVLASLGMFLFPTQAHERYALGAVGFGAMYVAARLVEVHPHPRPLLGNWQDYLPVARREKGEKRIPSHPGAKSERGEKRAKTIAETDPGQDFRNWRGTGLYAMISALVTLNLWWAAPPFPSVGGLSGTLPAGMIISAGFVFAAGWGAWHLWQRSNTGRDHARPN